MSIIYNNRVKWSYTSNLITLTDSDFCQGYLFLETDFVSMVGIHLSDSAGVTAGFG